MRKRPPEPVDIMKLLLRTKGVGTEYILHKLSEECLELSHVLHKALGERFGPGMPDKEKAELLKQLHEEAAHTQIFLDLLRMTLKPEVYNKYYIERLKRIKKKFEANGTDK